MVLLEITSCCVKQFRNYDGCKFCQNVSGISKKEEKQTNTTFQLSGHFRIFHNIFRLHHMKVQTLDLNSAPKF